MRFGGLEARALYNAVEKGRFPVGPTRMQKPKGNKPEQATQAGGVSYPFHPPFFVRTVLTGHYSKKELPFLKPASGLSHITQLFTAHYADKEDSLLRP